MDILKDFFNEIKELFLKYKNYIILLILFILFFSSSYIVLIFINLFNIDINSFSNLGKNILNITPSFLLMIFLLIVYRKDLIADFKKLKKDPLIKMDTAFRYWIIGLIIMIASNFLIQKLGIGIASNETRVNTLLDTSPFIYGLSIAFIGPVVEELIFRKAFYDAIKNKWAFIISSGLIFGSLHIITSFTSVAEFLYLIPYCSLGISFAFIMADTKNVWPSIIIHIIHNTSIAFLNFLLAGVILW